MTSGLTGWTGKRRSTCATRAGEQHDQATALECRDVIDPA
jgi:hypothetical protein